MSEIQVCLSFLRFKKPYVLGERGRWRVKLLTSTSLSQFLYIQTLVKEEERAQTKFYSLRLISVFQVCRKAYAHQSFFKKYINLGLQLSGRNAYSALNFSLASIKANVSLWLGPSVGLNEDKIKGREL